jgi:hypothetical protein
MKLAGCHAEILILVTSGQQAVDQLADLGIKIKIGEAEQGTHTIAQLHRTPFQIQLHSPKTACFRFFSKNDAAGINPVIPNEKSPPVSWRAFYRKSG